MPAVMRIELSKVDFDKGSGVRKIPIAFSLSPRAAGDARHHAARVRALGGRGSVR